MELLKPYEHCVWFTSWRSWAGQGGGLAKAMVLSEWTDDAPIPIVVSSNDLHEWRDLLDQAAKKFYRVLEMGWSYVEEADREYAEIEKIK